MLHHPALPIPSGTASLIDERGIPCSWWRSRPTDGSGELLTRRFHPTHFSSVRSITADGVQPIGSQPMGRVDRVVAPPIAHRSGLAHHAPGSSSHEFATRGSVVVTWTWFRSRCTCQVSLQRLMRRHPLPSTGSLGLLPPLQRYYEVLRLPAARFAALRFLRLAIPSLRPLFVSPGPGRGAVDQSGVGRRYLQPPGSMEEAGSPKFPEVPL